MKYVGQVTLDKGLTLGDAETVEELIQGVGIVLEHKGRTFRFQVETERPDGDLWDLAMVVQELAQELAAMGVDLDPRHEVDLADNGDVVKAIKEMGRADLAHEVLPVLRDARSYLGSSSNLASDLDDAIDRLHQLAVAHPRPSKEPKQSRRS
jgi:hypothetical protein